VVFVHYTSYNSVLFTILLRSIIRLVVLLVMCELLIFAVLIAVITELTVHLYEKQQESVIFATFRAAYSLAAWVRVLFVRRGHSISVLIVCETLTGLRNLATLNATGELKPRLEELFRSLLANDDPQTTIRMSIKKMVWRLADFYRCYRYFNQLSKRKLLISDQMTILLDIFVS